MSSKDDLLKVNSSNDANSEEDKSDASIPLPKRTGNFDADISPTPKVPKSLHGLKVKRSKSASTSGVAIKGQMKDANDTDTSDVNVPCSGTVSGIHVRTKQSISILTKCAGNKLLKFMITGTSKLHTEDDKLHKAGIVSKANILKYSEINDKN